LGSSFPCSLIQFVNPHLVMDMDFIERSGPNFEERQYLNLIDIILEYGRTRADRTATGVKGVFGKCLEFDLFYGTIPLLTTKKINVRNIITELLWFISGSTDANVLKAKGVNIWNGNTSREYLDAHGLSHYEEGDAGPIYGHQWRHFGAEYVNCKTDYTGKGFDQLTELVRDIRENPTSRRLQVTALNPTQTKQMVLPACHNYFQCYVNENLLSMAVYQRSADVGLGLPYNIASYAILLRMIAHVTGMTADRLIIHLGDTHIYNNHQDKLKEQTKRTPDQFPRLKIRERADLLTLDDFCEEDFEIIDYKPQAAIALAMAV
jgi:thymidylate synthase